MIPTIGIMIGCYIVTRMMQLGMDALQRESAFERVMLKLLAFVTIVVAVWGMISLMAGAAPEPTGFLQP